MQNRTKTVALSNKINGKILILCDKFQRKIIIKTKKIMRNQLTFAASLLAAYSEASSIKVSETIAMGPIPTDIGPECCRYYTDSQDNSVYREVCL